MTDASTAIRRVPASRRIAAGPKVWVIVGELPERNLGAVVPIDEQRPDRVEVVAPVVAQPHDEIEAALADPDLGCLFADQADSDRRG